MKERKSSLALKTSNSFDDEDDELDKIDTKDKEDKKALLSKNLQRTFRDKRNKENRKKFPQKKNFNRNDQGGSSNTSTTQIHNLDALNSRNLDTASWIALFTLKSISQFMIKGTK